MAGGDAYAAALDKCGDSYFSTGYVCMGGGDSTSGEGGYYSWGPDGQLGIIFAGYDSDDIEVSVDGPGGPGGPCDPNKEICQIAAWPLPYSMKTLSRMIPSMFQWMFGSPSSEGGGAGGIFQRVKGVVSTVCSVVPDAVTTSVGADMAFGYGVGLQVGIMTNGRSGETSLFVTYTESLGLIGPDAYVAGGVIPNAPSNRSAATAPGQHDYSAAGGISRTGTNIGSNNYQATYGASISPATAAAQQSTTRVSPGVPVIGYLMNLPRAACKLATGG